MAIITFWSNGKEETAKTLSISAIATYMAIEHNLKILVLSTNYNDTALETCYWKQDDFQSNAKHTLGVGNGIEELARAIMSNKASPEVITNYTKIVLKNHLEVLPSIKTDDYAEYEKLRDVYLSLLRHANSYYDMVFVDLNKGYDSDITRQILEESNLIVVNLVQRLKTINDFMALKEEYPLFKKEKILLLFGRYDRYSKYSKKNICRYMGEKEVYTIPYSTLYFEAANEGGVPDFFFKFRKIDENDRNALFISEVKHVSEKIIYKLQELQMKR